MYSYVEGKWRYSYFLLNYYNLKLPTQTVCVRLHLLIGSFNQLSGAYAIATTEHAQ